jgi:putative FmdB family regulatory protein
MDYGRKRIMKFFDFICKECQNKFEKMIRELDKVECPQCGSTNTEKIPGVAGFQFKGVGLEHRKK